MEERVLLSVDGTDEFSTFGNDEVFFFIECIAVFGV
jgi:hypothetical protein